MVTLISSSGPEKTLFHLGSPPRLFPAPNPRGFLRNVLWHVCAVLGHCAKNHYRVTLFGQTRLCLFRRRKDEAEVDQGDVLADDDDGR
jgi:hypothetical protein